jgi:hypothetical protein
MRRILLASLLGIVIAASSTPGYAGRTDSLALRWKRLLGKSCCLLGRQYCFKGKKGKRHCTIDYLVPKDRDGACFNRKRWRDYLLAKRHRVATFLLTRLSSTKKTQVHTCPFLSAVEGEVAVYALQQIVRVNWFELSPTFAAIYKKASNPPLPTRKKPYQQGTNPQAALKKLLRSKKTRKNIAALFSKHLMVVSSSTKARGKAR